MRLVNRRLCFRARTCDLQSTAGLLNSTMKTNLSGKFCLLTVLFLVAAFVVSCKTTPPLAAQQANFPKDKVDARGLFIENCATCHVKDGHAKTFHGRLVGAQNLTDAKFQAETSDEEISTAIKKGPKAMPAFAKKLSPSEIDALAAYVRT